MPTITNTSGRDLRLKTGVTLAANASAKVTPAEAKTLAGHPNLTFTADKPAKKTPDPDPKPADDVDQQTALAADTKEN